MKKMLITTLLATSGLAVVLVTLLDGMPSLASHPSAPPQPNEIRVGQPADGGAVTLVGNQVLVVGLESNPSTGYGWQIQSLDQRVLRPIGQNWISSSELFGAPGIQEMRFVGVSEGQVMLVLVYRRPWEKAEPLRTFTLQVRVVTPAPDSADLSPALPKIALVDAGVPLSTLPSSFNWCDQGGCTPIRDQGNCGSCWAFGTVGLLESKILIQYGLSKDLSEQYLISCNTQGWGCDGGSWAHDYHQWKVPPREVAAGAVYEADFPYQASDDVPCNPPHTHHEKIVSWTYVGNDSSVPPTADIKQVIYEYGPVVAAVCAGPAFQSYSGGIFQTDESSYCGGGVNHAIVLVGWDDTGGYWILRNSWGTSWGESGYMRIKYGVSRVGYAANYIMGALDLKLPWPAGLERCINGYGYWAECAPYGCMHKNKEEFALDFGLNYEPVAAAAGGTVAKVYGAWGRPEAPGWGKYVEIAHDDGVTYAGYAHLSEIFVQEGQHVALGQIIANSGMSGNSGGVPHLHFYVAYAGGPYRPEPMDGYPDSGHPFRQWSCYRSPAIYYRSSNAPPDTVLLDFHIKLKHAPPDNTGAPVAILVTPSGRPDVRLFQQVVTTDNYGHYSSLVLTNIAHGVYDIYAKPRNYLGLGVKGVTLSPGSNYVDFSQAGTVEFLPGDINVGCQDNVANSMDAVRMHNEWDQHFGQPSEYDWNRDGILNSIDVVIFQNVFLHMYEGEGIFNCPFSSAVAPSPESVPHSVGSLQMAPSTGSYSVGDTFDVAIFLDTGGAASDGANVIVGYDPGVLEVTEITTGTIFPSYFPPKSDPATGHVFVHGFNSGGTFQGSGALATISFKVTASVSQTTVTAEFMAEETADSNIADYSSMVDVLGSVGDASYLLAGSPRRPMPAVDLSPISGALLNENYVVRIIADVDDTYNQVQEVQFFAFYDGDWHYLGNDKEGTNGWIVDWNVDTVADQVVHLWAYALIPGGSAGAGASWNLRLSRTPPSIGFLPIVFKHVTGPTPTASPTPAPTATGTPTPSFTPSPTPVTTPTPMPTATPTPTPVPSSTATPTTPPTPTPTPLPWWDPAYSLKRQITVSNNDGGTLPAGYPVRLHFDGGTSPTAAELYNASQSAVKGDDFRIVYQDAQELSRFVQSFTPERIDIWFKTLVAIPPSSSDGSSYQLYYGNPAAVNPPGDIDQVMPPGKDANTVGLWHFYEGSGTTVHDSSGNGRHATIMTQTGGNWQWGWYGKFGGYLQFFNQPQDGDGAWAEVSNGSGFDLAPITVEALVRRESGDVERVIVAKRYGSETNWKLFLQDWKPAFEYRYTRLIANDALPLNGWAHVAGTYDGFWLRLYVNGQLVKEQAVSVTPPADGSPLRFGKSADHSEFLNGSVQHVRISNTARGEFSYMGALMAITVEPSLAVGDPIGP